MKYVATYLSVIFLVCIVICSLAQASTDTNEAELTKALNLQFVIFFSFNILASVAFWFDLTTLAHLAIYFLGQLGLVGYAFFDLRGVVQRGYARERLPIRQ